ncbi:hypothetical protein [Sporichthya polymorpha]|uniref:hypothetical protein n=1 Tax=Sporichthya polymorpha TaxID=35751 RepID=UPI000381650B|nr:hypothetical protein [Sporichthya polymorpha]
MLTKPGAKTQVTIRVSAELVAFVDDLVANGDVASRAAYFDRAGERERRHWLALNDLRILEQDRLEQDRADTGDLGDLAAWAAKQATDLD